MGLSKEFAQGYFSQDGCDPFCGSCFYPSDRVTPDWLDCPWFLQRVNCRTPALNDQSKSPISIGMKLK